MIHGAYDLGINYIDTSDNYGNRPDWDRPGAPPAHERKSAEEIVGAAVKGRRHDFIIATKVSPRYGGPVKDGKLDSAGLDRAHIMKMAERSLRRLETDYIDIYNAHHPDPHTPIDQTLGALEDLVRAGKIRYYTLGGYPAWEFVEAVMTATRVGMPEPAAHQVPYTITNRAVEREIVPACLRFGISLTTYAPFGGGYLAGLQPTHRPFAGMQRYRGGQGPSFTPEQIAVAEKIEAFGKEWGYTPSQLAVAWVLSRPGVANVVVGAESLDEIKENALAADISLAEQQLQALSDIGELPPTQRASAR